MILDLNKDNYFYTFLVEKKDFEDFNKNDKLIIDILKKYSLKLAEGFILLTLNEILNGYDIIFVDSDVELLKKYKIDLNNFSNKFNINIKDEYIYISSDLKKNIESYAYLLIDKNNLFYATKK